MWFDNMLRENARKNIIDEANRLDQKLFEERIEKENNDYFKSLRNNKNDGSGWCENCDCNHCRKHKIITIYANETEIL